MDFEVRRFKFQDPSLPFISCVILGELTNLSGLCFTKCEMMQSYPFYRAVEFFKILKITY